MKENTKAGKSAQQILIDELDRQLEENPPKLPSREEFRAMAWERLEQEQKKNRPKKNWCSKLRKLGLAAGFVLAILAGALVINAFTDDVGADKNPKEEIETENGVIIEDGGWGSFVEEGEQTVITDWEEVETIKEKYPQIMIPYYVPEGYEFDQLVIERIAEESMLSMYIFENNKKMLIEVEIYITAEGSLTLSINDTNRTMICDKGKIYFQENEKKAIIPFDDGIVVNIWHNLSEKELIKLVESIE